MILIKYPISKTANGTYTISLPTTGTAVYGQFLENGSGSSFFYGADAQFGCQSTTITVEGASNDTTTTFKTGTSVTAINNEVIHNHTNHTATASSVPATYSNAYLTGVVAASGKMPSSVKYATSVAGLATGGTATETSTGSGIYEIPMNCNTGSSMFVKATVTASDNHTQVDYIVEIPRGKYDVASLSNLGLKVGSDTIDLYSSATATTATTFNSLTTTYHIRLKSNQTSINITPTWDTTKNQTCKITTSAGTDVAHATSGSGVNYTHSGTGSIVVKMTSEDGNVINEYTINVYRYSDDAGMSYFKYGATQTTISQNAILDSGNNYTGNVSLGTTAVWFKFKPASEKATLQYSFEDGTTPGSFNSYTSENGVQCTFTSGTGGATMTIHVKVTSESGLDVQEYILQVTRDAGSRETGINGIKVSYNNSSTYDTATNSGSVYTIANKYTFTNLTNDNFKFQIDYKSGESGKQTIKYWTTDNPSLVMGYTGNSSAAINFSQYTVEEITVIIEVQAQDTSVTPVQYELHVTRDKASDKTNIGTPALTYKGSNVPLTNSGTTYTASGLAFGAYSGDQFQLKFVQGEAGQKLTYTSDDKNSTAGTATSGSNVTFTFQDSYGETTVIVTLTVTALDNDTTQDYTFEITRSKASSDVSLSNVAIIYKNQTYQLTPNADGKTYEKDGLAFGGYSGDQFQLKFTQGVAGQKFSYTSNDNVTAAGPAASGVNIPFVFVNGYLETTVTITLTVTAVDTTTEEHYTIKVTRNGASKEVGIQSIVIGYNGTTKTPAQDGTTYTVSNMDFSDKTGDYLSFKITQKEAGQSFTYNSDDAITVAGGATDIVYTSGSEVKLYFSSYLQETITVTVKVLAPDHDATEEYTIIVSRKAAATDKTLDIDSFKVYKVTENITKIQLPGSFSGTNYILNNSILDYAEYDTGSRVINSGIGFDVKIPAYAKVNISSSNSQSHDYDNSSSRTASTVQYLGHFMFIVKTEITVTYTITVTAQDSSTSTYEVSVTRRAANDDTSGIVITAFSSDQAKQYVIKNPTSIFNSQLFLTENVQALPYATKDVNIIITSSVATTKIFYQGNDITNSQTEIYQIQDNIVPTSAISNSYFEFTVYTEADDTGKTLKVIYSRVEANRENSIDLSKVILKDDLNNEYGLSAAQAQGKTYTFSLDSKKGMTGYYITGVELSTTTSLATIYAKDGSSTDYTIADKYSEDTLHEIGTGNTTYLIIVSEAGVANTYTINVNYQEILDDNPKISSITITELDSSVYEWSQALKNATTDQVINLTVPYSIKRLTFIPQLESNKASFDQDERAAATNIPVGTTNYKFRGIAQDGTLGVLYTYYITRLPGNEDNLLTKLTIGSTTIINGMETLPSGYTQESNEIHHLISPTSTNVRLSYVVSTNAIVDVRLVGDANGSDSTTTFNTNLTSGARNEIVMRITSEKDYYDGNTSSYNEYHINIYPASDELTIDDITAYVDNSLSQLLVDSNGNNIVYDFDGAELQTFNIPYSAKQAYIDVALPINLVNVVEVKTTTKGTISQAGITYTIVAKSQFATLNSAGKGQTKTFKIKLIQDAPSLENRLADLRVKATVDGALKNLIVDFDKDNKNYACENMPSNISQVTVEYELLDPNHSKIASGSQVGNVAVNLSNNSKTLTVTVLNELDQSNIYTIVLTTGQMNWETNCDITDIQVLVDNSNIIPNYESSKTSYPAQLRATVSEVVFHVATYAPTTTVTINGNEMVSSTANTLNTYTAQITKGVKNTFNIIATAQDGQTKSVQYVVELTSLQADRTNTLKVLNVNGVDVADGDVIKVSHDVESVQVLAQPDSSAATLSSYDNPKELVYGENIISITCTPEEGPHKTYTVKVIRDYPAELEDISIYKKNDTNKTNLISVSAGNVPNSITVPTMEYEYGVCILVVDAKVKDGYDLTIEGNGEWLLDETGKQFHREIIVKASSGAFKTYDLYAEMQSGHTDNLITSYKAKAGDVNDVDGFSPNKNTISYVVSREVSYFTPAIEVSSTAIVNTVTQKQYFVYDKNGNEIISDNPQLVPGKNTFVIKVFSETHEENAYTVNVYQAENLKGINNIYAYTNATDDVLIKDTETGIDFSFANFAIDGNDKVQTIHVSYKQSQIYLTFELEGNYAKVYVNGNEFTKEIENGHTVYQGFVKVNNYGDQSNVFKIYALSELGSYTNEFAGVKSETYILTVYREALNSDTKLKSLEVMVNGVNVITDFEPDTYEYLISEIGSVSQITINAEANAVSSTVTGTGNRPLTDTDVNYYSFTVTCTAEDNTKQDYIVKVSRTAMSEEEANNDNSISFDIIDNNNKNLMSVAFNSNVTVYAISIPYSSQSYIIKTYKNTGSNSTAYIDGELVSGMQQFVVGDRTSKTHTVYAINGNKVKGTVYTINVTFEEPSTNTNLASITINDKVYTNPSTTIRLEKQPNSVATAVIRAVAEDSKAKIIGAGEYTLQEGGEITATITVEAENGDKQNYTITIPRAAQSPYLSGLKVTGAKLLDPTTSKETDFYRNIYKYLVKVDNGNEESITIPGSFVANVDNPTYTVFSDNASKSLTSTTYVNTFDVNLKVGKNVFNITVQSPEDPDNYVVYVLEIERKAPQSSDATIAMLKVVATDGIVKSTLRDNSVYDLEDLEYTVSNSMTSLDVIPTLSSTTASYNVINKNLKVGENDVIVLVTAEDGTRSYTTIKVTREDYEFNIAIEEIDAFRVDYALDKLKEKYTVSSDVASLTYNITHKDTSNTEKIDYVISKGSHLEFGDNKVRLEIICDGNIYPVEFTVTRENYSYNIASDDIENLERDHKAGIKSNYVVPSNVTTVDFAITNVDDSIEEQPTYTIISGEKLLPGDNIVEIQIKAADGSISTEKINVHRSAMEFKVLEKTETSPNYACVKKSNTNDVYTIDLGKDGKATDIANYADYISFDSNTNDLVVETLTDTTREDCNEVILLVKTADGSESKIVKIELESTKTPKNSFDIYVWIVLGLALIILIAILVCVNRDKYGSVVKKRKSN